jgi:hypothetical protein
MAFRLIAALLLASLLASCEAMGTDYVGPDPVPIWAPQITSAVFQQEADSIASLRVAWATGKAPFRVSVFTPAGFEQFPPLDDTRRLLTLADINYDIPAPGEYTVRVVIEDALGQQVSRELTAQLLP